MTEMLIMGKKAQFMLSVWHFANKTWTLDHSFHSPIHKAHLAYITSVFALDGGWIIIIRLPLGVF